MEGHESQVSGSKEEENYSPEKPVLLVEIEQRHLGCEPIQVVFSKITDSGYEGYFLDSSNFFLYQNFHTKNIKSRFW